MDQPPRSRLPRLCRDRRRGCGRGRRPRRPHGLAPDFRGFAGTVAGGAVMPGDPVVVMGPGPQSRVKEIVTFDGRLPLAIAGDAGTLTLEDEIHISPGAPPANPPD